MAADVTSAPQHLAQSTSRGTLVRVAFAATAGSAIEGFDFLVYGTAAALVFNKLFFPTVDPAVGTVAAFGSFAAGFFARPIGGLLFGHFGDRVGRKAMLMVALIVMGLATVLIGCLPTYASAGLWAPVLLILLRVVQGISFGGEMAGAMLLAVEHAPTRRRGVFGSLPQSGSPLGLLLATGAFALASSMPESEFLSWGWRLPFLASILLVMLGVFIRMRVGETPDFAAAKRQGQIARVPVAEILVHHWRPLLLTIGGKLAEVTLYFTLVVFSLAYVTSRLGFTRGEALQAITVGAACQAVTQPLFGWLADRVGVRPLYVFGGVLLVVMAVPLFQAIGSGSHVAFQVAIVLGLSLNYAIMFGPQSLLYVAQFPPALRYTGMSLGIQIAAALGGGLAPLVAGFLVGAYGGLTTVGIYIGVLAAISAGCAALMRSPTPSPVEGVGAP